MSCVNRTSEYRTMHLEGLGFTVTPVFRRPNLLAVSCTQCQALVINGIATHESGCQNARHECAGCSAWVPVRVKYCPECS